MAVSPSASARLYRTRLLAVILLSASACFAQLQRPQKPTVPDDSAPTKAPAKKVKGPRALALIELSPNGAAHLIPIAIQVDGQFYDASAYKAAPIPMALESGTVYEGEKAGTSVGLFTISGALKGTNDTWGAAGYWDAGGARAAAAAHKAEKKPRDLESSDDGPPVLHRRQPKAGTPASSSPSSSTPSSAPSSSAPSSSAPSSSDDDRPTLHRRDAQPAASSSAPASTAPNSSAPANSAPASPSGSNSNASKSGASTPVPAIPSAAQADTVPAAPSTPEPVDPDAPTLRRGRPRPEAKTPAATAKSAAGKASTPAGSANTPSSHGSSSPAKPVATVQLIPAISDAGGPEPHPYTYIIKPEDEQQLHKKMLTLASDEIVAHAKQKASQVIESLSPTPQRHTPTTGKTPTAKAPQPVFSDVQFHLLDPSISNEPVLVMTASAVMPQSKTATQPAQPYLLTLVAREDIYGDLHKMFSNITDAQHLDVQPRYDFIDVVDADGDGRGELLFRKVSDTATAYVIYRVIGNQLWALFDGPLGG